VIKKVEEPMDPVHSSFQRRPLVLNRGDDSQLVDQRTSIQQIELNLQEELATENKQNVQSQGELGHTHRMEPGSAMKSKETNK